MMKDLNKEIIDEVLEFISNNGSIVNCIVKTDTSVLKIITTIHHRPKKLQLSNYRINTFNFSNSQYYI